MSQKNNIEVIEKRLWKAADTLRANSELAGNEYFLPVMGLIFLRHAYSRFLSVKDDIMANLPRRGGKTRALTKEDFSQKSAIFLDDKAQFDYLITLTDADDRGGAIIQAMESIERDYTNLKGQLPKQEYRSIPGDVLKILLNTLSPDELKTASGDIFGRIYEYFLTQFADQGAHDGGEFFTPVSLVQMIVNVLEPDHGKIFDPACGSGGMFVQSAHFMERHQHNPNELTFYGNEKNKTTTRLAKMNLAVHGLEGNIAGGVLSYYNDPHTDLLGNVDFVMANPPFNVDEVDAQKIKNDKVRLPFGLPGVNKKKKVSNANYLWIQYFYSYLNDNGRAGFVMSSQASSAGRDEAKVRQQLIKTGHVDVMMDIRSNFFYTRTVPCQLWFLNKAKPTHLENKVLMIDARNVYRKVTRKIYDFTPEQLQNLTAIVWLHRGQEQRFVHLVQYYIDQTLLAARHCDTDPDLKTHPMPDCVKAMGKLHKAMLPFLSHLDTSLGNEGAHVVLAKIVKTAITKLQKEWTTFQKRLKTLQKTWKPEQYDTAKKLNRFTGEDGELNQLSTQSRELVRHLAHTSKQTISLIDLCEKELGAKKHPLWKNAVINGNRSASLKKAMESFRNEATEQLKQVRYFQQQSHWLLSRFPDGKFQDVEGLVKRVDISDIEKADWSLTPGRYVGVAPEVVDEDFDFAATMQEIHAELAELNLEAAELAKKINQNFEVLEI